MRMCLESKPMPALSGPKKSRRTPMATNEWGMLRDIFTEVADERRKAAMRLSGTKYADEIVMHLAVATTLESIAEKMRKRGGMTPDELAVAWQKKLETDQSEGDTAASMTHARFVEAIMGDMLDAGSKTIIAQAMDDADKDDLTRAAQED